MNLQGISEFYTYVICASSKMYALTGFLFILDTWKFVKKK